MLKIFTFVPFCLTKVNKDVCSHQVKVRAVDDALIEGIHFSEVKVGIFAYSTYEYYWPAPVRVRIGDNEVSDVLIVESQGYTQVVCS